MFLCDWVLGIIIRRRSGEWRISPRDPIKGLKAETASLLSAVAQSKPGLKAFCVFNERMCSTIERADLKAAAQWQQRRVGE